MELFATFRGAGGPDRIGLEFDTCDVVLSHIWHLVEHWVMFISCCWYIRSTWIHPRRPHIRGKSDSASPFWTHTSIAIAIKNWLYSNRWFNPFHVHHCVHVHLQLLFWTAFCICTVFRLRPFSLTSLSYFCYITYATPNNAGPRVRQHVQQNPHTDR